MKVRLIKAESSPSKEKEERPVADVSIVDTIRSWVREFKSNEAGKARLEFKRVNNLGKT